MLTVRSMEAIVCFPPILLALLVVTLLGPGAATLVIVLSILYAPGFTRVAYRETLSARNLDYVDGAGGARREARAHPHAHDPAEHRAAAAGAVLAHASRPPSCWKAGCRFSVSASCRRRRPGG